MKILDISCGIFEREFSFLRNTKIYPILKKIYKKIGLLFFKKPIFKEFNIFGFKFGLWLDPSNGEIDEFLYMNNKRIYEPKISKKIISNLKEKDTFLDVGANIGYYTNLCASKLSKKEGKVIAFEPISSIYKQNKNSIEKNRFKNILLYNFGCGDKKEDLNIYINSENVGGASLFKNKYELENKKSYDKKERVSIVSLDAFLGKKEKIDLVKIDVEGFEYSVLKGMKKIINKNRPKLILEFSSYIYENIEKGFSKKILNFLFNYYRNIEIIETGEIYRKREKLLKKSLGKQLNLFCYN